MLNKPEYILYFRFLDLFRSSHLLLWWQLCTLLAFFQSASWGSHLEWFSNSLEGVPRGAEHLLAALPSLCGPTHHRPSQLGWVIVEARSSDPALHHSPSWSYSPYIAWRCVWGHCPVEIQMMVPLSANQMGWHVAAECFGSHAGLVCLEFWINHKTVSPAKHPHTITPPPQCFTVGTTHVETIRSPLLRLTKTRQVEPKISNLDSSDQSRFPLV